MSSECGMTKVRNMKLWKCTSVQNKKLSHAESIFLALTNCIPLTLTQKPYFPQPVLFVDEKHQTQAKNTIESLLGKNK